MHSKMKENHLPLFGRMSKDSHHGREEHRKVCIENKPPCGAITVEKIQTIFIVQICNPNLLFKKY